MPNAIQPGSHVTLHYNLSLADGTVVDSTHAGEPATYTVGNGELVVFLEQRDMAAGLDRVWHVGVPLRIRKRRVRPAHHRASLNLGSVRRAHPTFLLWA